MHIGPTAIGAAVALAFSCEGYDKGKEEADQPQPNKQNMKETREKVKQGGYSGIAIPALCFLFIGHVQTSCRVMMEM